MNYPNILLISLDELVPSRLGCYGNKRKTSPNIDVIASEGTMFLNCISHATYTSPSHMSIMTSQLPSTHGLMLDKNYPITDVRLAKVLKGLGYSTVGFTGGGFITGSLGFSDGFNLYDEYKKLGGKDAPVITERTLKWLLENHKKKQPFFLFFHIYTIHWPYNDRYYLSELSENSSEIDRQKAAYDGGVRNADIHLEKIFSFLRKEGLIDNTIIVILSDHGTVLSRPEYYFANNGNCLYDEIIKVPLIIRYPKVIPANVRIERQSRLIDVFPTLLELIDPSLLIRDEINKLHLMGRSLVPLACGKPDLHNRDAISETLYWGPERKSIRTETGMKLILTPNPDDVRITEFPDKARVDTPRYELYNINDDPEEKKDLSSDMPDIVKMLEQKLEPVLIKEKETLAKLRFQIIPNISRKIKKQLRSLGYI
ncbi:MAG: sulfatase [Candidatus Hydrogenedentota bacterium]